MNFEGTKYQDFKEKNTVWTFVKQPDGEFKFQKYYLNHLVSGDTDSCMMLFPKEFDELETVDDYCEVSDEISSISNDSFAEFCEHAFNCPKERSHLIATDREVVFDRAFFLTKKRYILRVVDDEGKRGEKLKIMGVEIKKSNTSEAVKTILMGIVNRVLDGCDEHEVKEYIKQAKKDYRSFDLRAIATPMNCKTLKTAQAQVEATGSKKGIHYSARSALFYNENCSIYDKKVNPGEKIGLLYIRNPKSKYIGFPLDYSNLPDWLYEIQIDYDTMWDKTYKTVTNYLAALEWDFDSKKSKVVNDLFGI